MTSPGRLSGTALAAVLIAFVGACNGNQEKGAPPRAPHPPVVGGAQAPAAVEPTPQLPQPAPAGENAGGEGAPLVVVIGGDVMLQMQIIEVAELQAAEGDPASGWAWFFHALGPLLEPPGGEAAAMVVNLESPVATQRVEPKSSPPTFNGPPEALEGLKRAGVDIVTLSNNHAFDQGRAGLGETIDAARLAGLAVAGAGKAGEERNPALAGGEGAPTVAIFSYLVPPGDREEPDGQAGIALFEEGSPSEVAQILSSGGADAAVVILHWIGEFVEKPLAQWKAVAASFVEAGASAVVCHGPHVVGPAGWVEAGGRKAFVAWSVGNLVANFGWEVYPGNYKALVEGKNSAQRLEARREALVVLRFEGAALERAVLYPLWLDDNRFASLRKGGDKRAIFPMPIPSCRPEDAAGCPGGAKPAECALRWDMIFDSGRVLMEKLWDAPWPAIGACGSPGNGPAAPPLSAEFHKE